MTRKEDILDAMSGAYWFSTMDLISAYYQVRMREEDIKFTAFQAPNGLWDHTYIFTKSTKIEDHLEALRGTLDILRNNKLYVKLSKCVFCASEISCLGDFVGRNGVRMDPDKVQTINDWPVPRTQEELHSFLGLTGYVQRFCPEYASLTATMFALLKKKTKRNAKIHFSQEQLKNFKELKRRLCNPPVLYLPDFSQPMHLRTDASKFAVGGVLFQVVDGVERPIAYNSRKMKSAELNYPTQQQELLAIVHALAAFRIYCLDKPPIVETDHKSLEGLFTQKMANRRLARWYDILAEYQPTFSYLPGAKNGIADALSRRPDLDPETKFFHDLSVTSFNDTSFSLALSERRNLSSIPKREQHQQKQYRCYSDANGLLWYQLPADDAPRIVVPNDVKLRQLIISECHDTNYGGHPGAERTYLTLARHWYWSKMMKSIKTFIADCEPCRRNKPRLTKPPGLLEPLSIPDERWRSISMDFITDLPRTKREVDSIWVVVDRLTKRCHFVPTMKTVTAESVARLFIDNIWKLHGMPTHIVSDRDRKFVSVFWQHVFKSIGTKLSMTVAHRAQGDGQTERMNRTLDAYLRCFVGPLQDDWDLHLANAEFAISSTINTSTKHAPFKADLGYIPPYPLQLASEQLGNVPKSRQGATFHERQAAILLSCREALAQAQERMRDLAGLPNSTKFGPKWIGPYTIVRKIHNHAYELNIQAGNKLHPVFNTGSLKRCKEPSRWSRPHDVILADGTVGQLVHRLLGKCRHKQRTQFLVEWVGEEKPTWEPVENLT
ncbi:unnamed protein product [Phytophthora fragariaefolia]|uniref:Unnamed protein product n=1 Tax=Phytophthora fragariaefolia TaxID=1490495 RepID=A0A9W6X1D0_9STRA|nr:unnamed protein product [Phytophthora fragariaefolia]